MTFNIPILLTWLRIVAIPLLITVYYLPAEWASSQERNFLATMIFMAAAFTDWADGFLARRLNQTSAFGAFLDPVADKLMVAAALIMLVQLGRADAIVASMAITEERRKVVAFSDKYASTPARFTSSRDFPSAFFHSFQPFAVRPRSA